MEEDICDDVVGSEFVERFGRFVSIVGSVWEAGWRDERGENDFPIGFDDWFDMVDRGDGAGDEERL